MATLLPPLARWLITARRERPAPHLEVAPERISSWPWTVFGLMVVAGMVLFFKLGSFRTLGSHEIFAVVPAREMMESGNYVFPTFGGLPRLRKPPLVYWLVAGSATLCGELSPLSARLPSALAGLLLAGLMGTWAKRWYGSSVGWAAAFVQLTSVWFVMFARKAEIDIVLCLFNTTALFLVADQPDTESRQRSFWRWLAFYVLLSLAWMAKFHYGPSMILAPVGLFFLVDRKAGRFRKFLHPVGMTLFAAALVVWPLLVLEQAPNAWEIWRRETVGRALGEMGSHNLFFYVPFLVGLPLPWTFFALASLRRSWQAAWNKKDSHERFLWIWFFAQFAILMVSANKHKHYLLALLPIFTLLAARSLSDILHGFRAGHLQISRKWVGPLILLNIALGVALLLVLKKKWPELSGPALILALTLSCCEGSGWILLYYRRVRAVLSVNILSLIVAGIVIAGWFLPNADRRVNVQIFAEEIRSEKLPTQPVCVFCMDRDPLVYHLGSPVYRVESVSDLSSKLQMDSPRFVIGYEWMVNDLKSIADVHPLARLPQGKDGIEPVEGDLLLVKLTPHRQTAAKPVHSVNAN
ncbi:MAG: glycosyltransferase family 39 protein [Planctomycetaceae bacterium]|nr:glycosyltransferase family 39 protein [Planctomycetaceae bacterium]